MPPRAAIAALLLPLLLACSKDETTNDPSGKTLGQGVCAEGFVELEGDMGCVPVIAEAADCKPGTRGAIGDASCASVGVTTCAPGFARDGSGWGCNAILPEAACTGATRERLGKTTCEPISDCDAAFPPPEATHFVDPTGPVDAKHFKTITDAIKAVPGGAVIAIESGTYREKVILDKSHLRLVGRCAEKVILQKPDGADGSGIEIGASTSISLERFSLKGFNAAVSVLGGRASLDSLLIEDGTTAAVVAANPGADLKMKNVVVRGIKVKDGANQAFGVFASHGANVVVEDSVISGSEFANVGAAKEDTKLSISRSIIKGGVPWGSTRQFGMGIYNADGATLTLEESAVLDNTAAGVNVFATAKPIASATIRRSVIRGTKLDGANKIGRGVEASGSKLVLEETTIAENAQVELVVAAKTTADVTATSLVGRRAADPKDLGALGLVVESGALHAHALAIVDARAGVELQGTGTLTLDASLVKSTRLATTTYAADHWVGLGIAVESKASLDLTSSTIEDAHSVGLLVLGTAKLEGSLVRGTRPSLDGFAGRAMSIQNGGSAEVTRSAFVDNTESGVIVMLGGSALTMRDSTITKTEVDHDGNFGLGLLFGADATGTIDTSTITKSKGVGVTVAAAGGRVRRTWITDNVVGVHAQEGSAIEEGDDATAAHVLSISRDTRFVGNATRSGNGVVVLPPMLQPTQTQ